MSAALEGAVRDALNGIIDPCSRTAGAPAGLGDMGLIMEVRVDGAKVSVKLGVTSPMCLMAGVFLAEARARVAALPGVESADVDLDHQTIWTPALMDPAYGRRLDAVRAARDKNAALDEQGSAARPHLKSHDV
jgi:metal-sulfur cluster biosynthetic enzyme